MPSRADIAAAAPVPRRSPLRSIPVRLAAFALALALPILGLAGIVLWQYAAAERVRVEDGALDRARGIAVAVERELAGLAATLEALALSPSLQAGNLAAFGTEAAALLRRRDIAVVLRDLDGRQLVDARRPGATDLPRTPFPEADAAALRERRPAVSGLFTDALVPTPHVAVVIPVARAGSDAPAYLLALVLPVERLRQIVLDEGLPEGWTGALVDGADRIVARQPRHEAFVGGLATQDLREQARGAGGTWAGTSLEGLPVFGAYARVRRSDWRAVVGVQEAELRAPLMRSLTWFALVGTGLSALALLLALAAGRSIVRPIRAIGARAAALGRGEVVAPLGPSFADRKSVV